MKTFCDKDIKPIEIKLIDRKGNEEVLTSKFLTMKDFKEITKITSGMKESNSFDKICEQLVYVFGGEIKDYEKYSFSTIKGTIDYVIQQAINPTKQEQVN